MSVQNEPSRKPGAWLRPTVEYVPIVLFFIVAKAWGLMPATAVLIVASVAAVGYSYYRERRLAWAPVVTTAIVCVFGGLTLIFKDETFVKMKPTIVEGLFAVTLWTGLLLKRPLLQHVMGQGLRLDQAGWRKLEFRFALFCAALAVLNEIVWRTQSTDTWVNFKLSLIVLTMLFMATQLPMIRKHMLPDEPAKAADARGEQPEA